MPVEGRRTSRARCAGSPRCRSRAIAVVRALHHRRRPRDAPAWLSWTKHRAVVAKSMQHAFTRPDLYELRRLIDGHLESFDCVDEYDDLDRPKHHFQDHLVEALERFGPLRGVWCLPWEGYVQVRAPRTAVARSRPRHSRCARHCPPMSIPRHGRPHRRRPAPRALCERR